MSTSYNAARRVALGLEKQQETVMGGDLWNISLGEETFIRAEMPFQFFNRGFEPPDEQTAQKAALMLYDDEYNEDCAAAEARFTRLKKILTDGDSAALSALLQEIPPEEWLNLVFLDGTRLEKELPPLLKDTSSACREILSESLDQELNRLVDFKDLAETLRRLCRDQV